jgi:hypothetical protein
MTDARPPASPPAMQAPQVARLRLRAGPMSLGLTVRMTPAGLLALGGLVSGILLSTTALVWAATATPRRHPLASALLRR